jgi:uncharacterized protein YecA (UPF0149 family)
VSLTTEHWTNKIQRSFAMNHGNGVLRQLGYAPKSRSAPLRAERYPYRDVGRNDPCLRRSGKKFKKCCLPKVEAGLM